MTTEKKNKKDLLHAILSKNMLICLFNGFTAGLPLFYLWQLVPAWLRTEGVDLKTIGLFALIQLPYNWKFIWSPLTDRYTPPFLGRRRGWMLITQILLMLSMLGYAFFDPKLSIWAIAYISLAVAFFSSTQDIVLDAYRRELLPDEELGLGNSMYINGYRLAGFIPGGLGLILADHMSWPMVHTIIALFMLFGIIKTLLVSEIAISEATPKTIKEAVIEPFKEFFQRKGISSGFLLLAFIFLYKIGDQMATSLITPFFLDVGFSKTVIGSMIKGVSTFSVIFGTFVGGAIIFKMGINRSLYIFGVVQLVSIAGFAVLSEVGPNKALLGAVIAFEYIGVGLGSAGLIAFTARESSKAFTATQLALFSSVIALPRTFASSITGFLIEGIKPTDGAYYRVLGEWAGMGYTNFFYFCIFCAIPGMVLLKWVAPWNGDKTEENPS